MGGTPTVDRLALVTGGTGYIGSHLVPALARAGWAVRATARRRRPPWLATEVEYVPVDLAAAGPGAGDLDELLAGVTHLFHLAGASSSLADEAEMHRSNVLATRRLVGAAATAGLERMVHMSSTSVYGEEVQLPSPVPEDVEPRPSRGYGKAKWGAEQVVWEAAAAGLPVSVLRPVTVYGPGNLKLLASTVLDAAVERFAGAGSLVVPATPVEQRLVHVDDLVAACLHLAEDPGAAGRAFNVVLPHYPTSHEVVGIVAAELGLPVEPVDDPDAGPSFGERCGTHRRMVAAGMEDRILLTPERFRLLRKANRNNRLCVDALLGTGFAFAETDLAASIGRTIAWYRRHRWIL